MLKFVAKAFTVVLDWLLALILIGCVVVGAVMADGLGWDTLAGIIVGALVGVVVVIIFGGLLSVFVNMCKEVTDLKETVDGLAAFLMMGHAGELKKEEEMAMFEKMEQKRLAKELKREAKEYTPETADNEYEVKMPKGQRLCAKCGTMVSEGNNFCNKCGNAM